MKGGSGKKTFFFFSRGIENENEMGDRRLCADCSKGR